MNDRIQKLSLTRIVGCGALLFISMVATGCQVSMNGQTLPSANYLTDDVQYFAPGPEFKLSREAAAAKSVEQEVR